jgi:hypothetical protein
MFLGAFGTPLAVYVWQNLVSPKIQKQNRRDVFEGTLGKGRSEALCYLPLFWAPSERRWRFMFDKIGRSKIPKAKPQGYF